MEDKLLYELEYQVNELRKQKLNTIEYNDMTIKELLDLGFDDCFIRINKFWYDLGYKWYDKEHKQSGYESSEFQLSEEQLKCMVHYVNDEISDYNYQQVSVELVNEEDSKYFLEESGANNE